MNARAMTAIVAVIVLVGAIIAGHPSAKPYSSGLIDVSWPNCKTEPDHFHNNGIIGVTGGLDFHANPCLAQETSWFASYSLYINTGYPGSQSLRKFPASPKRCAPGALQCPAYNYGYNATLYAIRYADLQNAHATKWWLDVETENSWTDNFLVNRASLQGAIDAIKQNVPFSEVGVYSSPDQWAILTGKLHNGLPAWLATGSTARAAAVQACRQQGFTGGRLQLTQYTQGLDQNLTCSASGLDSGVGLLSIKAR
jgi:hypothetical protein